MWKSPRATPIRTVQLEKGHREGRWRKTVKHSARALLRRHKRIRFFDFERNLRLGQVFRFVAGTLEWTRQVNLYFDVIEKHFLAKRFGETYKVLHRFLVAKRKSVVQTSYGELARSVCCVSGHAKVTNDRRDEDYFTGAALSCHAFSYGLYRCY